MPSTLSVFTVRAICDYFVWHTTKHITLHAIRTHSYICNSYTLIVNRILDRNFLTLLPVIVGQWEEQNSSLATHQILFVSSAFFCSFELSGGCSIRFYSLPLPALASRAQPAAALGGLTGFVAHFCVLFLEVYATIRVEVRMSGALVASVGRKHFLFFSHS